MYKCDYCSKIFKRESTLAVHMCEPKRRIMQKDDKNVQLGFRAYQLFYKIGTNTKNDKTYEEFAKSQYYISFCKFGYYCRDIGIDDVPGYATWLIRNQIKLDNWGKDHQFANWMKERLRTESVDRGVERTIIFLQQWAEENKTHYSKYFNDIPSNLAVFHICSGKISPWVLFNSKEAQGLIDRLTDEQLQMITDYLETDYWQRTMSVNPQDSKWVEGILEQAGI